MKILKKIRSILFRILVLTLVFVISVAVFERLLNQSAPVLSGTMANASFPLVYIQDDGVTYNCLHGYSEEMDVNYIRDTVTILDADHQLNLQIQPFNMNIESVSCEVLTLDGTDSLENTDIRNLTEEDGYVYAEVTLQNQIKMNHEYILKLNVKAGERDIYFYTRLLMEDGLHLDSYLDFVTGFYEKCVNKTDQASLGTVAEPDETTGTSQTLATMDIHDTVNQLMWGDLNPQMYYKPTPSLVDINGTTASFVLEYRISAADGDGVTSLYNVKEFYRLRYTDTRVYLLDFTRNTDEIFNTSRSVLQSEGINLGITGTDVEYAFDEDKNIVAFVQENELWTYEINSGTMTRVFGFPQQEEMDYRDFYDRNNIKILRVESTGDVWYAVSGYMNRGDHEGENGIAVYHYEQTSTASSELLFIKTMESYDQLRLDIDALAYMTDNSRYFYVLLENVLYQVNTQTGACESMADGICSGCYVSSSSNRYFSWLKEGERYDSQTLCTIDLETGEIREQTCGSEERIRPVAYMGEDLVYGLAYDADIDRSCEGGEVFPMYRLCIVSEEGETIKTYEPSGIYVTDVETSDGMLTLTRVVMENGAFQETTSDNIVSTGVGEDVEYGVTTQVDDTRQTEILLRVGTTVTDDSVQVINGKLRSDTAGVSVEISPNANHEKLYYVYAGGCMESCWPTAVEAILRADEKVGVVVNDRKQYVWERGNKKDSCSISLDKIPDIVKTGTMDEEELEAALPDADVLNLTGCTLDQVLYFVSEGRPVLAATASGTVIITGYDDYGNLELLTPGAEETELSGPLDSEAMFEEAGNRFISYIETE